MSRFPPIPKANLEGEQKETYNELKIVADKLFGGKNATYLRESDGAFLGPFATLLYGSRSVAVLYLKLVAELGNIPGFPPNARETAILAVGAHFEAIYETNAHKRIAIAIGALSEDQANDIISGKKPREANEGMSIAWEVATLLASKKGPLDDELWEQAKSCFGREGAAALIHYVGFYAYTCILLNGADTPLP